MTEFETVKYRVGMSLVPFWEEQLDNDGGPCKLIRKDPNYSVSGIK